METKTKTKNISIPFIGFYESIASDRVQNIAFYNFISEKGIQENMNHKRLDIPEDLTEKEQEEFWDYYQDHYEELEQETATAYMEVLGGEIGLDLKFESIISPKQYNFTTDRLFCNVLESELLNLYNLVDKKILAETIKEKFTSYDGFISFYDNDINAGSWQFPAKYDHNQWETVIEAYVKEKGVDLLELYYI